MPHVKEQLYFARIAVFMTEAHHLDAHRRALHVRTEMLDQQLPERVHGMLGGIYNLICEKAYLVHRFAFGANTFGESVASVRRERTTSFAETAHEDFVGGFK